MSYKFNRKVTILFEFAVSSFILWNLSKIIVGDWVPVRLLKIVYNIEALLQRQAAC